MASVQWPHHNHTNALASILEMLPMDGRSLLSTIALIWLTSSLPRRMARSWTQLLCSRIEPAKWSWENIRETLKLELGVWSEGTCWKEKCISEKSGKSGRLDILFLVISIDTCNASYRAVQTADGNATNRQGAHYQCIKLCYRRVCR